MPIYKYTCDKCSLEFEEVVRFELSDDMKCPSCGASSKKEFPDSISVKTQLNPKKDTVFTPKEIDKVIGEDADKKREIVEKRQKARHSGQPFGFDEEYHERYKARQDNRRRGAEIKEFDIPKDSDGKYTPIKHLGDETEKRIRSEFSDALTEHRQERSEKGEKQFEAPGSIDL